MSLKLEFHTYLDGDFKFNINKIASDVWEIRLWMGWRYLRGPVAFSPPCSCILPALFLSDCQTGWGEGSECTPHPRWWKPDWEAKTEVMCEQHEERSSEKWESLSDTRVHSSRIISPISQEQKDAAVSNVSICTFTSRHISDFGGRILTVHINKSDFWYLELSVQWTHESWMKVW